MLLLVTATDGWWDCDCDEGPWSWVLLSAGWEFHHSQSKKIQNRENLWEKRIHLHPSSHKWSSTPRAPAAALSIDIHSLRVHREVLWSHFLPVLQPNPLVFYCCHIWLTSTLRGGGIQEFKTCISRCAGRMEVPQPTGTCSAFTNQGNCTLSQIINLIGTCLQTVLHTTNCWIKISIHS